MAYTADDYTAMMRYLAEHPGESRQLGQAIYADSLARSEARFERIESTLERLAEAQARTEARVEELAQAQVRTEARLDRVEAALEKLAQAQARTEARVEELAQAQARTEARVEELAQALVRVETQVGQLATRIGELGVSVGGLKGMSLELRYQNKAMAYFGPLLRGVKVLPMQVLDQEVEPKLSRDEFLDVLRADLLLAGRPRYVAGPDEVWLVVEVSWTIDQGDVDRARRRAALLRQAGLVAVPVVAGESLTLGAEETLRRHDVVLVRDGRTDFWETALAAITD